MIAPAAGSQLAQVVPATAATPEALFAGAGSIRFEVTRIHIVAGATGATATLYHDDDGTTRDATTRIFREAVGANATRIIESSFLGGGIMLSAAGELAAESSADAELTFTVYGIAQAPTQQRG